MQLPKLVAIVALSCLSTLAQTGTQRFAKDGLTFDYPAGWNLSDKSNPQAQHLILTRPESSALIMVIAHRDPISSFDQLTAARGAITEPSIENVARKFGVAGKAAARESVCTEIGGVDFVAGTRLHGAIDKQPSTGEIYSLVLGRRFVNLVYIRMNKDDTQAVSAWDTIRNSIKIEAPVTAENTTTDSSNMNERVTGGGMLIGKALSPPKPRYLKPLSLPKPPYSDAAKAARASGVVDVLVTVSETGDVISARAIAGPALLKPASEEAARHAKFSPTLLCGKPVKVTGVITYNFIAR